MQLSSLLTNERIANWRAGDALTRFVELGTAGYSKDTRRRLVIVNLMAYLIFVSSLIYAINYAFFNFKKYELFVFVNLFLCFFALIIPFSHRISEIAGGVLVAVIEYTGLFCLTALLGRDSGIQLNYLVGTAVPFLVFNRSRRWLIFSIVVAGLVLHIISWLMFPPAKAIIQAEAQLLNNIYICSALTAVIIIAATIQYAFLLVSRAEAQTEALLRNILPEEVADRLKTHPNRMIADSFPDATVLFADFEGFTPLAKALGAEKTVALLNTVFTEFDRLAETLQLEKIKTIGDAYMVVGGITEPAADHSARVAQMALGMLRIAGEVASRHSLQLNLRIGIAAGPVMAGVIGKRKFFYDVWGETVNFASRLESHSVPGKIQVTDDFVRQLESRFCFELHGVIPIKGVGEKETWYLTGMRF